MISTLVFIITLSILIIVHEFGHFITAKRLGVKIEKFSLGFGPKIFSVNRGGTQYSLSLIPLGGYIKMAGDSLQDFKHKQDEFLTRPVGQRAKIIAAGPLLNYILALFCFWAVFFIGYPTLTTKVGALLEDYPAKEAGVLSGDVIIMVDNQLVKYWGDLQEIIHNKTDEPVELLILRDKQSLKIKLYPKLKRTKNIFGKEISIGLIGIKPSEEIVSQRYGFFAAFSEGLKRLLFLTGLTLKGLWYIISGSLPLRESVTGPLGIFKILGEATQLGVSILINVIGVLSMSLAIFNILPIPVLDGGHLFFLLIEKVRGRQLSHKSEDIITQVGLSLLIMLALFIFYNDLMRFGIFDKLLKFWTR